MALYCLLLCGIIANSKIFNIDNGLYFILSLITMVADPCVNFYRALTWIFAILPYSNSKEWVTLVTAESI